jgi:hypothetical protein
LYFAYGIRNSFGIDFDPLNRNLWDTENGSYNGDEINPVKPGFSSAGEKFKEYGRLEIRLFIRYFMIDQG